MKIEATRIASLSILATVILLILGVAVRWGFRVPPGASTLETKAMIGEVGHFLFARRVMEFLGIAFIVLATVACCGAMLRKEVGEP